MDESHRHNIDYKKSDIKENIMHDSVYMKFKNRQNQFVMIGVRGWLLLVCLLTAKSA